MDIHEYQAKELLAKKSLPVPLGQVAYDTAGVLQAAEAILQKTSSPILVVKAQIHAGGRGKGYFQKDGKWEKGKGGVRVLTLDNNNWQAEVKACSDAMLNQVLITQQTGHKGKLVRTLYLEQGLDIAKEFYLSLLIDRAAQRLGLVLSVAGGMNIEEVAKTSPAKIMIQNFDLSTGIEEKLIQSAIKLLGLDEAAGLELATILQQLWQAFKSYDCSLIEINPLVLTKQNHLILLDAKMTLDDNALFRHPEFLSLVDESEQDPMETRAKEFDLSYIKLDGTIGCMVNGAGLAMATMDIIKQKGGSPANFLDVGGGATAEKVTKAFEIILSDKNVKGILVNIFGGIMRCDIIATGIITAMQQVMQNNKQFSVPLVVRLEGTSVKAGQELLRQSGLPIITANSLEQAAVKVVAAIKV